MDRLSSEECRGTRYGQLSQLGGFVMAQPSAPNGVRKRVAVTSGVAVEGVDSRRMGSRGMMGHSRGVLS